MIYYLTALINGFFNSVNRMTNVRAGKLFGTANGALINYVEATVLSLLLMLVLKNGKELSWVYIVSVPWWVYLGSICEYAETKEFFENPCHPYTQMLLASIPVLNSEEEAMKPQKVKSVGEIPSPLNKPKGCPFNPRCPFKKDICSQETPQMKEVAPGHFACCHCL